MILVYLKVYQGLGSVGKNIKGSASCYRLILALFNTNCAIHNDTKQFTGYTVTAS